MPSPLPPSSKRVVKRGLALARSKNRVACTPIGPQRVVRGVAAARRDLGFEIEPVVEVPVLAGVLKHEIPWSRQLLDQVVCIGEARADKFFDPGFADLAQRLLAAVRS